MWQPALYNQPALCISLVVPCWLATCAPNPLAGCARLLLPPGSGGSKAALPAPSPILFWTAQATFLSVFGVQLQSYPLVPQGCLGTALRRRVRRHCFPYPFVALVLRGHPVSLSTRFRIPVHDKLTFRSLASNLLTFPLLELSGALKRSTMSSEGSGSSSSSSNSSSSSGSSSSSSNSNSSSNIVVVIDTAHCP